MKKQCVYVCVCFLGSLFFLGCQSSKQSVDSWRTGKISGEFHEGLEARPLDEDWWMRRHQLKLEQVKTADPDLLFVGDSITEGWDEIPRDLWEAYFKHRKTFNLGISADQTGHVLWRIDSGEFDGLSPKVTVVKIGTNNISNEHNDEMIADGIIAVCDKLKAKMPTTKILLLSILPRVDDSYEAIYGSEEEDEHEGDEGEEYEDEDEQEQEDEWQDYPELAVPLGEHARQADRINKLVEAYYKGSMTVSYLDVGKAFVDENNNVCRSLMPDFLHLSKKGYETWAKAMEPTLKEMLGE